MVSNTAVVKIHTLTPFVNPDPSEGKFMLQLRLNGGETTDDG